MAVADRGSTDGRCRSKIGGWSLIFSAGGELTVTYAIATYTPMASGLCTENSRVSWRIYNTWKTKVTNAGGSVEVRSSWHMLPRIRMYIHVDGICVTGWSSVMNYAEMATDICQWQGVDLRALVGSLSDPHALQRLLSPFVRDSYMAAYRLYAMFSADDHRVFEWARTNDAIEKKHWIAADVFALIVMGCDGYIALPSNNDVVESR